VASNVVSSPSGRLSVDELKIASPRWTRPKWVAALNAPRIHTLLVQKREFSAVRWFTHDRSDSAGKCERQQELKNAVLKAPHHHIDGLQHVIAVVARQG
jgi:hypothetical protein